MPHRSLPALAPVLGLAALFLSCAKQPSAQSHSDAGPADVTHADIVQADAAKPDLVKADVVKTDIVRLDSTPQEGVLIDDFEDGDDQAVYPEGATWYSSDDASNGGASSITYTGSAAGDVAMTGPGYESDHSLEVSFTFDKGRMTYDPYVAWGLFLAVGSVPLDVSKYVGLGYTYKGSAHRIRVQTYEVTDYDYLGMDVGASADWTTVVVPFSRLCQEGWGEKVAWNPENVGSLDFEVRGTSGSQGKVDIDNLMFLTRLPEQPPDMTVMQPQPPADDPISSITITHPGQAKARAYLTRGYNITNWLEQDPFTGFTYDEAYVRKLAAAGFKSLRLPIDLDRFVLSSSGTGDDMDVVVSDELFTVLDAFDLWTRTAGISLTIDYHQYDRSIDKAKPETVAMAVALWGKVAAHFAGSPREDLFFELLNEPELSMDGTPFTQDEWTAVAERMIAAIRASDTTHSILFGDVEWYGIDTLSSRKPLSDPNVIYVFHDYDPFIFTHQGASWAGMASTHDIPYPYDPERWSIYFGDLGFNPTMESWLLSDTRDYYKSGNRSAVRNHMLQAKQWAVTNNVPVICNEFGAYDRSSRLEDRARYLADVVTIFEELDIPWQHWFMTMTDDGTVAPEYRAALKLGQ